MTSGRSHHSRASAAHRRQKKANDDALAAAIAEWQKLPAEIQMRLAREIVVSRSEELRLAYRNVISLGFGYRTKGKTRKRIEEVVVKFVVRRKWDKKKPPKRRMPKIPERLFVFSGSEASRVKYAVPTDVECGQRYRKGRAAAFYTNVRSSQSRDSGALAAAVTISGGQQLFGVSCEHMLGLTNDFYPDYVDSDSVGVFAGGKQPLNPDSAIVAKGSKYRGFLVDGTQHSFDSALCTLTNPSAIALVMPSPRPQTYLGESDTCPSDFTIWTPRSGSVPVKYLHTLYNQPVPYSVATGTIQVTHPVLIETDMTTEPGDSGSPGISQNNMLVGMVLSRVDGGCLLLPAWSMLTAANYDGLSTAQTLQLAQNY